MRIEGQGGGLEAFEAMRRAAQRRLDTPPSPTRKLAALPAQAPAQAAGAGFFRALFGGAAPAARAPEPGPVAPDRPRAAADFEANKARLLAYAQDRGAITRPAGPPRRGQFLDIQV